MLQKAKALYLEREDEDSISWKDFFTDLCELYIEANGEGKT